MEDIKQSEQQKFELRKSCQNKVIFNEREQKFLQETLDFLAEQIHVKRIHLKSNFKDFDISNRGVISKYQFQRTLHKLLNIQMTDTHMKVVVRNYLTNGNEKEFNYLKFIKDIDQIINEKFNKENFQNTNNFENYMYQKNINENEVDLEDVLRRIKKQCELRNKDIKLFFQDFDKLRKNMCEISKLKFCLSALDINLQENEIDFLTQQYLHNENSAKLFQYKKFLNDFQNIQLVNTKNKNNLLNGLQKYIEKAKQIQSQRNFYLKQKFQDFDINKEGTVTYNQFRRVLSFFELLPEDESVVKQLAEYLDYNGRIKYPKFLYLLGEKHKNTNLLQTYTPIFQNEQETETLQPNELEQILIQVFQQMRLQENIKKLDYRFYLKSNDNLKNGKIDNSKFISFLNIAGFNLQRNQRDALMQIYSQQNRINYKDFLADYQSYCDNSQCPNLRRSIKSNEVQIILDDLKEYCQINRIYLKQFFKNFDKFNRLKIKKQKFEQVLHSIGYYLEPIQLKQFYEYITDSTDDQLVDYKKILDHLSQQKSQYTVNTNSQEMNKNTLDFDRPLQTHNFNQAYQQLLEKVQTQRIELKQYFQDFDPLNKKVIRIDQFTGVLDKILNISKIKGYQNIIEQFKINEEFVDYEIFMNDLQKRSQNLQNCKKRQTKYQNLTNVETIKTNLQNQQEIYQLEDILKEIAFVNKKAQIFWQLYFKEIDKLNKGYVCKTKVRSLLDRLGMQFTNDGFELLLKSFSKNTRDFDYLAFIDSIAIFECNQITQKNLQ